MSEDRLEYLRTQIRGECISYGELMELQSLADEIDPSDVELLEWAGVPESLVYGSVGIPTLVAIARDLRSEDGENPEYDRALIELVCEAAGLSMDDRMSVAARIGVKGDPLGERKG